MKILHLSIMAILTISIFATMYIPSVFAENDILKLGPPASNMSIQEVNVGENMSSSRSTIHKVYPPVNVTKFMSIVENSAIFEEQINGYTHYSLATVILKPESQNTSNPTIEYNLVYSLYKDPNNYCSYNKVLVITLDVQLQIMNTTEYSPYGVPAGYPLPPISCPMNFVPGTIDYNKLAGTIPWSPPLEQLNYGISAENVSCINGLMLVLKSEDGSPACVKPKTAQKLIERGWSFDPSNPLEITGLRDSYAVGEIINFQVKFNEMIGDCTEPSVWVTNQTNQTVWKSKEITVPCPPDLTLHHTEGEMKFGNSELGYLSINQTGTYYIHAWFGKEITKTISII
ncbi:MAG: hypothetical protein LV477_00300 [Candidatus Nitrosotalea sp.]|nr:hypothetical protein [Candidatus Nitrosotalea sp.]